MAMTHFMGDTARMIPQPARRARTAAITYTLPLLCAASAEDILWRFAADYGRGRSVRFSRCCRGRRWTRRNCAQWPTLRRTSSFSSLSTLPALPSLALCGWHARAPIIVAFDTHTCAAYGLSRASSSSTESKSDTRGVSHRSNRLGCARHVMAGPDPARRITWRRVVQNLSTSRSHWTDFKRKIRRNYFIAGGGGISWAVLPLISKWFIKWVYRNVCTTGSY